jgi:hypothetical protein
MIRDNAMKFRATDTQMLFKKTINWSQELKITDGIEVRVKERISKDLAKNPMKTKVE